MKYNQPIPIDLLDIIRGFATEFQFFFPANLIIYLWLLCKRIHYEIHHATATIHVSIYASSLIVCITFYLNELYQKQGQISLKFNIKIPLKK